MLQVLRLPPFFLDDERVDLLALTEAELDQYWAKVFQSLSTRLQPLIDLNAAALTKKSTEPRIRFLNALETTESIICLEFNQDRFEYEAGPIFWNVADYLGFFLCELYREFDAQLIYQVDRKKERASFRKYVLVHNRNPGRSQFHPNLFLHQLLWMRLQKNPETWARVPWDAYPQTTDEMCRDSALARFHDRLEGLTRIAWVNGSGSYVRTGPIGID